MGHPQRQKASRQPTQMRRRRDVSYTERKRRASRGAGAASSAPTKAKNGNSRACAGRLNYRKKQRLQQKFEVLRGKTPPFAENAQDGAPAKAKGLTSADANAASAGRELQRNYWETPELGGAVICFWLISLTFSRRSSACFSSA